MVFIIILGLLTLMILDSELPPLSVEAIDTFLVYSSDNNILDPKSLSNLSER